MAHFEIHFRLFTKAEDDHLRSGYAKHMKSKQKWSDILNDDSYEFQPGRNRESLRMRALTLELEKRRPKSPRKKTNP